MRAKTQKNTGVGPSAAGQITKYSLMKNVRCFIGSLAVLVFGGITVQHACAQDNGWKFESQRNQISPKWYNDTKTTFHNKPTLGLSGDGKEYVDGHYSKTVLWKLVNTINSNIFQGS
jgi:hypothetical protein